MNSVARRQELKFLAMTAALVVFVGAGSFLNLVRDPVVSSVDSSSRAPASVPSSVAELTTGQTLSEMETLDWSCGDLEKTIEVSSRRLRVRGLQCDPKSLQITNETNGIGATVFDSEKGFSTDYIELSPGVNSISVNWVNKKGQPKVSKLSVNFLAQ